MPNITGKTIPMPAKAKWKSLDEVIMRCPNPPNVLMSEKDE